MVTLWKSLILSIIEYGAPLTNPDTQELRKRLEGLQRAFTAKIDVPDDVDDYYKRLKYLNLYSLQRRRERYTIIYVWKIIQGHVPNLTRNPIEISREPDQRNGRKCKIPQRPRHYSELFENSFCVRGPRLFNALPEELRKLCGEHVKLDTFKRELDAWLSTLIDEPPLEGVVLRTQDNSITNCDRLRRVEEELRTPPVRGRD